MNIFDHQVTSDEHGKTLRQVLQGRFSFSRNMLRRCRQQNAVTVNGQVLYLTARVSQGDQIEIKDVEEPSSILPQPIPIHIIYEDRDLIVIDKPAGLVVHPTRGYPAGTLANGIAYYFRKSNHKGKIHLVNRLDKGTSGLLVVAKHAYAHAFLSREQVRKRYHRTYLALVKGVVEQDQGWIDAPIRLADQSVIKRTVCLVGEGAPAKTHFVVKERLPAATLLTIQLETGRTHQIRVHMAYQGHPLIGDELYGDEDAIVDRQALHASQIQLCHPRTCQWMTWKSFLPKDIMKCYHRLRIT